MNEIVAPAAVIKNIEATRVKKQAEALIKETREETVAYFRAGGTYPGVTFSDSKSEPLCEEVILKWAYTQLPKHIYEQLFTKVFDPNSFAKLVSEGVIDQNKLPPEHKSLNVVAKISVK